jgi:hypothetical protein
MKREKTFAQEAKKIMNRYKLRLGDKFDKNDPLARKAMEAELTALQQKQEEVRMSIGPQGGQQFAMGGSLPMYDTGGTFLPGMGYQEGIAPKLNTPAMATNFSTGINFNTGEGYLNPTLNPTSMGGTSPTAGAGEQPFQSRVPWMGYAAGAIGNLFANRPLDLPTYEPDTYTPEKIAPNLVDYSREREQVMRERDLSNAMITRGAASAGSQAGAMENIIAGRTGTQRVAGEQFGQSLQQEGNVNAQIKNQTSQMNAQQALQARQINDRNQLLSTQLKRENAFINNERKANSISGITDALSGYLRDKTSAGNYDQMVNMELSRNPNYGLLQSDPTLLRRILGITDPIKKVTFRNTNDKVS